MRLHRPTKIVFIILSLLVVAAGLTLAVGYSKFKQGPTPKMQGDIMVSSPQANASVASPLELFGKAINSWYFEGSFPVEVLDADGSVLGVGHVTALTDWMTPGYVSFSGSITFQQPKGSSGFVLFENDNPSGLPQNHKEFRLPVKFAVQTSVQPPGTCAPNSADCAGNPKLCLDTNSNKACD